MAAIFCSRLIVASAASSNPADFANAVNSSALHFAIDLGGSPKIAVNAVSCAATLTWVQIFANGKMIVQKASKVSKYKRQPK